MEKGEMQGMKFKTPAPEAGVDPTGPVLSLPGRPGQLPALHPGGSKGKAVC